MAHGVKEYYFVFVVAHTMAKRSLVPWQADSILVVFRFERLMVYHGLSREFSCNLVVVAFLLYF